MSDTEHYIYEFGPFRLDATNRLLSKDNHLVPLKPKVLDTLLVLVEENGRVLAKQELMQRIWPNTTVEENNLTQNISVLRKVLGLHSDNHQYIETIPRRGYRFTAPIKRIPASDSLILERHTSSRIVIEEEQTQDEEQIVNPSQASWLQITAARLKLSRLAVAIVVSAIGLAAILVWLYLSRRPDSTKARALSSLQLIQLASWKSQPREAASNSRFSPDGKMIVFSSNKGGRNDLFIQQAAGGESAQVTNDQWFNETPIWSPDGQEIAFVSERGDQAGIWSVPALGGSPKLLKSVQVDWPQLIYWSKDGARIYYELSTNLFALDLATKEVSRITSFPLIESTARNFSISPDERLIAYTDRVNGQRDIWVIPMEGGEPVQITNDPADDHRPIWHPDGRQIIYSSNRFGINQICVAAMGQSETTQITFADTDCKLADISSDGSRILYEASREESDLCSVAVDTGEQIELTSDLSLEIWPDISKDGESIAYQSSSSHAKLFNSLILARPLGDAGQELQLASDGFSVRWSPDGTKAGFLRFSNSSFDIWTVNATGGDERRLTTGIIIAGISDLPYNRKQVADYDWSPDGRQVAYCSIKSGRSNVWAISADGLTDTMVSNNPDQNVYFLCPLWSPDGKQIAHLATSTIHAPADKTYRSVYISEQGRSREIFRSNSILRLIGWSESGAEVLVALVEERTNFLPAVVQARLLEISSLKNMARKIADIPSAYFTSIQLSPDGKAVAFVSRQDNRDNIWVMPTTGGRAKKITGNDDPATYYSSPAWSPDGEKLYFSRQSSWRMIRIIDNFK